MRISKAARFKILSAAGFSCHYCGRKPPVIQLEVDHALPISGGGSNKSSNLVAACFDCNRGKGGQILSAPWLQRLSEAIAIDPQSQIEWYCDTNPCPVREVTVRLKDYDRAAVALAAAKGKAHCPVCSKTMKLHNVMSSREVNEQFARDARASVNCQLYIRDTGSLLIPASVLCDDTLPRAAYEARS